MYRKHYLVTSHIVL